MFLLKLSGIQNYLTAIFLIFSNSYYLLTSKLKKLFTINFSTFLNGSLHFNNEIWNINDFTSLIKV